jgi:DNA-3-methyladenine glycosylase
VKLERLDASELAIATEELARVLIGVVLVRDSVDGRAAGRIVETEAYVIGDPASHAYIGPRPRTASMFLEPFHSYVYLIYGTNFCFNITSEGRGEGAAVLVRALEPFDGIELMQRRRRTDSIRDLCRGPGRLAQALEIDRSLDGRQLLTDPELWLARPVRERAAIGVSRRIGITRAAHRRLRFYERGNPFVSGPRALSPP